MGLVRIVFAVALAVGTWGCSDKSGKSNNEGTPTATPDESTTAPAPETTGPPVKQPDDTEPDDTKPDIVPGIPGGDPMNATCVGNCVQRNGMRAVSAEQIESDCESWCTTCMETCVEASAMKAVGADQIEADCRRDCESVK